MGFRQWIKCLVYQLVLVSLSQADKKNPVQATGGGILKAGQTFEMSIDNAGEDWERCFWFFGDDDYCNFDLQGMSGSYSTEFYMLYVTYHETTMHALL